ncbi:DNA mismatch repair endonuclease MutL [Domibacillus epiphyticus]|uniref:DNA mismatch repair protein MutL n=1 Tax=Domibacillus epiphyticus TaxID=1714355 RepID=A0A1V2ACZ1_9BACI|nr:DNA mismatch repair endonuclease MutL [Domibacillus epiphyticus]OMP68674.1 DNA mismatch repair protein MutL [Domibacillus epiphyticus]
MGIIMQLDESLSNKIAAGEVVERPASVVKELTENALDACSTVIEIDVEEAGLSSIRISDNGNGITADDVEAAFYRHATSKIKDENDLFRIRTLGFRGEALPSIASVSELTMTTSTGEEAGTEMVLSGGVIQLKKPGPMRKGTEIVVSNLFFNTPARLKYMKSVHTELGNITDVVNRMALSRPDVSFRLRHNGRELLKTNGNGDARQVLAAIYGINIAKKMIPITAASLDFELSGFISLPEVTRASRNYMSMMVNGRFIKNFKVSNAILEGYHTFLPVGRYPIVLVNMKMDPILVDVNVHPSKLEVRFSKEIELCSLLSSAIKEALRKETLIPDALPTLKKRKDFSEQPAFQFDAPRIEKPAMPPAEEVKKLYDPVFYNEPVKEPPAEEIIESPTAPEPEKPAAERMPPLYPIGQMHGTYIFAQNENGLYMIDQHAAQERLKYEYFREKVGQIENELQELLMPMTFEFSADEYVKIEENRAFLEEVGVFLEPFGDKSYIVRAHPSWFPKGEEREVIEEMIEEVLQMKKPDVKKIREEAAILMSCKGSIKANRHLRNDEIEQLLNDLRESEDPFTCPHGRPIVIHLSTYDIEKMFKRIM